MYAVVVLPVSVCRMGVLAGWTPPFGLFLFAGICFAASGEFVDGGTYETNPFSSTSLELRRLEFDTFHRHST